MPGERCNAPTGRRTGSGTIAEDVAGAEVAGGATIADVAARAGVSVATVSRALRDLPNVAPATRERVRAAADELRYVSDPWASRLASGRSSTIGLVVPTLDRWIYARLLAAAQGAAAAAGLDVLPVTVSRADAAADLLQKFAGSKRVDGLLVVDAPTAGPYVREVVTAGVPVVTIGLAAPGVSSLLVDNVAAARVAVEHLLALGHRRIATIGGLDDDAGLFTVPVDRRRGYLDACAAAGVEPDPAQCVGAEVSLAGGALAMQELLAHHEPPTAVFAQADEMAIGALQVARDAGLRVPEDLSIVGFDDHEVAAYLGLTTIRQDVHTMGRRATHVLLRHLRGDLHEPAAVEVGTRLIVRATTGPAPTSVATSASDRPRSGHG